MDAKRSTAARVRDHRQRLRERGMRPIQIWVPDTRSPSFAAEAHRQSLLAAESEHERADQEFVDSITDWGDDE